MHRMNLIVELVDFTENILLKMSVHKPARIVARELSADLKQQDGSVSDQSDRSKINSTNPESFGGRRQSVSSRNAETQELDKDDTPGTEEIMNRKMDGDGAINIKIEVEVEEIDSKKSLDSLEQAAFLSGLPFDKMSSLEEECFSDLQGPSSQDIIQIRNRILKMWFENPKLELTEHAVQIIEAPYNSDPALVLRTHAFLERHGFINYGMYERNTPMVNPTIADLQKIKRDPEETQHHIYEVPLVSDGACSLYEDHVIKEEMVIGPVEFYGPNNEHLSAATLNEKPSAENPASVDSQHEVSTKTVRTKTNVKINETTNNRLVTIGAENENSFSSRDSNIVHGRVHKYSCDICEYSTNNTRRFNSHSKAHGSAKNFCCDMCSYMTTRKLTLIVHLKSHSNNDKPYVCKTCNGEFKRLHNLNQHLRKHIKKKPHACEICHKEFDVKCYLKRHMRTHTGERPYSCDICYKSFNQKCILNRHQLTHSDEKSYVCDICCKSFNQKPYLDKHLRTHTGLKPYSCDVCDKSFTQKCHLHSHRRKHTGEKPFSCDICLKSFTDSSSLLKHRRRKHIQGETIFLRGVP